jgi:hypothetical protein
VASIQIGDRFGNLTVTAPARAFSWLCVCKCGNQKIIKQSHLLNRGNKTCGCGNQPNTIASIIARLVSGERGCLLWTGAKSPRRDDGYGVVGYQGKQVLVHRLLYEHFVGPVPEGKVLDHFQCDTPSCANWAHVRPETSAGNVLRGRGPSAINARKTHCKNGHPLSGDNLVMRKNGRRGCRSCERVTEAKRVRAWNTEAERDRQRASYAKHRDAVLRRQAAAKARKKAACA